MLIRLGFPSLPIDILEILSSSSATVEIFNSWLGCAIVVWKKEKEGGESIVHLVNTTTTVFTLSLTLRIIKAVPITNTLLSSSSPPPHVNGLLLLFADGSLCFYVESSNSASSPSPTLCISKSCIDFAVTESYCCFIENAGDSIVSSFSISSLPWFSAATTADQSSQSTLIDLKVILSSSSSFPDYNQNTMFIKIVSGHRHFIALSSTTAMSSQVWAWMDSHELVDIHGCCGHGPPITTPNSTSSSSQPRIIDTLDGLNVTDIAAGGSHSLFIVDYAILYSCGLNSHGQLGRDTSPINNIDSNHQDVQKEEGEELSFSQYFPQPVDHDFDNNESGNLNNDSLVCSLTVAAGSQHSIVTSQKSSSIWVCGWNKYGQIGEQGDQTVDRFRLMDLGTETEKPSLRRIQTVNAGFWATNILVEGEGVA